MRRRRLELDFRKIPSPVHLGRWGLSVFVFVVAFVGCRDDQQGIEVSAADQLADADVHFAAGRFGEALRLYETLPEGDPDALLYDRLHRAYLALGLSTQARDLNLRRRAAGLQEEGPGAWHCDMGMIAIQAGDSAALSMHTDSILRIHTRLLPEPDPGTLECLAFLEVFARRYEEAKSHLELLATLDTTQEPPPNLAFLYLQDARHDEADLILWEAERAAAGAATASPSDPEPRFELAEFASMRGDVATAVAELSESMDRGLGRTWWIYQLFDPKAIPDPVFEPMYGQPDFERMRAAVVNERRRMQPAGRGDQAN